MANISEGTPGVQERAQRTGVVSEDDFIRRHLPLMEEYDSLELKKASGIRWLSDGPELQDDYMRACTAVMMENTRKFIVPESNNILHATQMGLKSLDFLGEATTPLTTSAWSGATTLPMVLGMVRKVMPRLMGIRFLAQIQPLDRPTGRIFFLSRIRHYDGTNDSAVENRAGWSYRSWIRDPGEGSTILSSFKLVLSSKDLTAQSRKYKTETTIEVEQDLRAYFGENAVALVSEAGAAEIAAELDEHITWRLLNDNTGPLVQYGAAPSGFSSDNQAWDQRLMEAIERASELIYTKKRVRPNRLVIGSEFSIYLKRLRQFQSTVTDSQFGDQNLGVQQVGSLDNRYTVLQMPLPFPQNDCLLVYQGSSPLDGTYIWAPYVPLQLVARHMDPATMVRTISWLRRDAEFIVDEGYAGIARIASSTITGLSYPAYTEYTGAWETSGGDIA